MLSTFHRRLPTYLVALACLAVPVLNSSGDDPVKVPVQIPSRTFTVEVPQPPAVVVEDKPAAAPKAETVENKGETTGNGSVSPEATAVVHATAIDPEELVTIVGPTEATVGSYFIVSVKVPPPAENVDSRVTTKAPDGAMPAIELAGKKPGELVYLFQQVVRGEYVFKASAQISVDKAEGFDPHDEDGLTVTVGGVAPLPPPGPGPTPQPPGPAPNPAPFPSDGLAVLITYETQLPLSAGQRGIVFGAEIRDFLNRVCKVGPDGVTREFRIWDDDSDVSLAPEKWQKAMAVPRQAEQWLVISNGVKGYSGPLPSDPEAFKAILQPFVE